MVDLPGIARNPIADQPKDIHKQTTNLIRKFIQIESSIILCVFPANVDIATVESFTLAREVDPKGLRTIGVITKCDLATNDNVLCQQLLMQTENVLQLKLGFIAVRNRAHDEIISIRDARKREEHFFQNHEASSAVGLHCLGVDALINCLANLYADLVLDAFPKMRNNIEKEYVAISEQMKKLPPVLETDTARLSKYYEVSDFYVNALKDRLSSFDNEHASLLNLFHKNFVMFEKELEEYGKEFDTIQYNDNVYNKMSFCSGEQLPNFLPYSLFKNLIKEKLNQLSSAADCLTNDCFSATQKLLISDDSRCSRKDKSLLQKLLAEFRRIVLIFMSDQKQVVKTHLQTLINHERNDPYTMNSSYMNDFENLFNVEKVKTTIDKQSVQNMLCALRSYWQIIKKKILGLRSINNTCRSCIRYNCWYT